MKSINLFLYLILLSMVIPTSCNRRGMSADSEVQGELRKIKDVIVYEDSAYFSAFPSVINTDDGEVLVAFRRSPDRRQFGEKYSYHVDPNSYIVAVRSSDGENWSATPELICAHPMGGSQDPCLLKLRDGTILCASYGWAFLREESLDKLKKPHVAAGFGSVFFGGFLLRSTDGGKSWSEPVATPQLEEEFMHSPTGGVITAYNRGALCEGADGKIYWSVVRNDSIPVLKTSNVLLVSEDKGVSWKEAGVVASDDKVAFNETSMYETESGDLIAFLRTANFNGDACISRSKDGGKTFEWQNMGFKGCPCHALRLRDGRVLLTYGYRHRPNGVRARILNPECTDFAESREYVLRDDGISGDLGYTWSVQLKGNRVLVVYYFNSADGTRSIQGTLIEV